MCESGTALSIAASIDAKLPVVRANLIRMYHLGQVIPIAIMDDPSIGIREKIWDLTPHSRSHGSIDPSCWACRLRDRYLCASEALFE